MGSMMSLIYMCDIFPSGNTILVHDIGIDYNTITERAESCKRTSHMEAGLYDNADEISGKI